MPLGGPVFTSDWSAATSSPPPQQANQTAPSGDTNLSEGQAGESGDEVAGAGESTEGGPLVDTPSAPFP
eukprot:1178359-Prorocentrum_minimum.AAC.1